MMVAEMLIYGGGGGGGGGDNRGGVICGDGLIVLIVVAAAVIVVAVVVVVVLKVVMVSGSDGGDGADLWRCPVVIVGVAICGDGGADIVERGKRARNSHRKVPGLPFALSFCLGCRRRRHY